jgi:hypothetical protein
VLLLRATFVAPGVTASSQRIPSLNRSLSMDEMEISLIDSPFFFVSSSMRFCCDREIKGTQIALLFLSDA